MAVHFDLISIYDERSEVTMKFNTLVFSSLVLFTSSAFASTKNICDKMIESGKHSDAKIKQCLASYGESEFYKEEQKRKKWQEKETADKSAAEAAKKANIETKLFTIDELDKASKVGLPFYALQIQWQRGRVAKTKRVTTGDALCKFLGYEKVLKSKVTPEIMPDKAHEAGLVIDTSFLGQVAKEPELFSNNNIDYTVRAYQEITCARVKNKDQVTSEELAKVVEDLDIRDELPLSAPKAVAERDQDNSSRAKGKEVVKPSPYGYKREERPVTKRPPEENSDEESTAVGR
jgi:hypothetical protein